VRAAGDTGPWTNPTVVYINSITVTGEVFGPIPFNTDASALYQNADSLEGQPLGYVSG